MKKDRLKQLKKNYKKTSDLAVQKGLMNIYSNKDGSLPDISHLDVRRKSRLKIFLISFVGIAIILAAIVWLGFIVFNPDSTVSNQSIKLEIKSQQSIASGDEVIYILNYANVEKVPLNDVEIIFRFPEGFEFTSATPEPTNDFNTSWDIDQLAKNASGKIEIKGKLIGEVGSIKTISATASYRPENFSSIFKDIQSFSSQITSSILEINVEGPEQILPEKKATYKILYRNDSDQDLAKIKVLVDYPANFIFQEALPEPFHKEEDARNLNNQWIIENLEKNQEGEIEITGGFLADEQIPSANFNVQIGFLDEEFDEFSLQQEKSISTEIIESNLSMNLIVNGSNQNQPISFGQILTYSIVYKNLGQKDLDDVSFTITLDSDILNFEEIEDKNFGIIDNNSITWGKDQISELDLVRPLDEGSIDFSIKVLDSTDVNLDTDNLQVKSKSQASLIKIGDLEIEELDISSNEILNNINTDIQLKVEGRYFNEDNIAVGTGPLPPVVGERTTFRIYWYIANSLHEVSDVVVSAVLPDGVEWVDKYLVKTGQISYSDKDNRVSWSINKISAGQDFQDINTWFDVAVIPTKQQEGKLLILSDQTFLVATDEQTESEISKSGKAVTSNLENDPVGGGRGLVIDITE
ncbi:MAG: hypothetical protein CMI53_04835 [Parcubacteria group bacterium]|nr:hypothetical protein [Parcubacteria group bacterium]|tara:strand:- start:21505 stop:23415 length:1911 start_codon:yes stop_codon:yes gene_type:complete